MPAIAVREDGFVNQTHVVLREEPAGGVGGAGDFAVRAWTLATAEPAIDAGFSSWVEREWLIHATSSPRRPHIRSVCGSFQLDRFPRNAHSYNEDDSGDD